MHRKGYSIPLSYPGEDRAGPRSSEAEPGVADSDVVGIPDYSMAGVGWGKFLDLTEPRRNQYKHMHQG